MNDYIACFYQVSTDQNVTDPNSLRLTIEKQISADYEHLKGHVHFLQVSCGQEFADIALHLISLTPTYGLVHPSLALLLSSSQYYFEVCFLSGCVIKIKYFLSRYIA